MMRRMRLVGLNKNKLAALVGSSRQQIGKLALKPSLSKEWADKCAPHLKCSTMELMMGSPPLLGGLGAVGSGDPPPDRTPPLLQANPAQTFNPLPAPQPSELTQTIPVYGSAQGGNGDGWFELNGHAIDHVKCPPGLTGIKGAYSLRVQGISMEPRYFEGELVYVNPARSVTPGCFVVIQMKPSHDGDPIKAFIKQLVRRTAEKLVVHQYQPDTDYDIPAGDVLSVHRIMNGEELF